MMDPEIWKTILSAGLIGTVAAIGWLIKTVIGNASRVDGLATREDVAAHQEKVDGLASKVDGFATKEDLNAHREKVAENYVRRDDYVPQVTQMNVKLDAIGGMVARLDERSREGSP